MFSLFLMFNQFMHGKSIIYLADKRASKSSPILSLVRLSDWFLSGILSRSSILFEILGFDRVASFFWFNILLIKSSSDGLRVTFFGSGRNRAVGFVNGLDIGFFFGFTVSVEPPKFNNSSKSTVSATSTFLSKLYKN